MTRHRPLGRRELAVEVARPWLLLTAYLVAAGAGWWPLAVPLALATYLAAFVQMHDAMHGALGLGRRTTRWLLSASALLLIASGHALRASHLRHHDPRSDPRESEEQYTRWALWRVLLVGPCHLTLLSWRFLLREPTTRWAQLSENAVALALLGASLVGWALGGAAIGVVYPLLAFACTLLMPVWAAWIPHRLGDRHPLRRLAAWGAARTPLLAALSHHDLHHRRPGVPACRLADVAGYINRYQ